MSGPAHVLILILAALAGCGTSWEPIDADGDGVTRQDGDCWDAVRGPSGSDLKGRDIHPDAAETYYDGIDQDCAGDDDYDQDGDGWVPSEHGGLATQGVPDSGALAAGDCWDDPTTIPEDFAVVPSSLTDRLGASLAWEQPDASMVNPDASETYYDGVDQDCEGDDDLDQDGDGFRTSAYPDHAGDFGEDCIDGADLDADNPAGSDASTVNPEASETWYDGTDQDCDENDCDQDGDGYTADGLGSGHCDAEDCDDTDAAISPDPGVEETWYDGVDGDCDGLSDYDSDYDGHDAEAYGGDDCDDTDPDIGPHASETFYDGIDQDCDGLSDYDADLDSYDAEAYGGDDCDDGDGSIHPGATETWYDGVDQDCDDWSDYDADFDGYDSVTYSGDDCDDGEAATFPGAPERWDRADNDCDELVDDMLVEDAAVAWLEGEKGSSMGHPCSIASGDIDGDGTLELLLGSGSDVSSRGTVWAVSTGTATSLAGVVTRYADPIFEGVDASGSLAVLDPVQGDLDGDGITDVAIGGTDSTDSDNVAVAVYTGGGGMAGTLTPSSATLTLTGADGDEPGQLSSHLDLDGDGAAELIYADWSGDYWGLDINLVYLVQPADLSGEYALESAADGFLYSSSSDHSLGRSLGGDDLDGDGYDDLLVGAPGYDGSDDDSGAVALFLGSGDLIDGSWSSFDTSADAIFTGSGASTLMGEGAPPQLADVDDDGTSDLILPEPATDTVYVFLGVASLAGTIAASSADATITGGTGGLFGQGLAAADFDGDGHDDLYVGAPASTEPASPSSASNGGAYLFDGQLLTAGAALTTDDAGATLSASVSSMLGYGIVGFDFTADGLPDAVFTAPATDGNGWAWLLTSP